MAFLRRSRASALIGTGAVWTTGWCIVKRMAEARVLQAPTVLHSTIVLRSCGDVSKRAAIAAVMHDASASAEVVAGPKICLYCSRDGSDVAGLRACGAAAGLA